MKKDELNYYLMKVSYQIVKDTHAKTPIIFTKNYEQAISAIVTLLDYIKDMEDE